MFQSTIKFIASFIDAQPDWVKAIIVLHLLIRATVIVSDWIDSVQ